MTEKGDHLDKYRVLFCLSSLKELEKDIRLRSGRRRGLGRLPDRAVRTLELDIPVLGVFAFV